MEIKRLSTDAVQRVSGPSWQPLKAAFLDISGILLSVSPDSIGTLTTIYVKFQLNSAPSAGVYAVVWLKTSKELVVGLSLSDDFSSPHLGEAPPGMKYKGINRYFSLKPGQPIPVLIAEWATEAYRYATSQATLIA